MFERVSKITTCVATLSLVVALVVIHPDITSPLQVIAVVAFLAGWAAGRRHADFTLAACVVAATAGPALVRLATGLEGPVLDIVWMAALVPSLLRSVPLTGWNVAPFWRPLVGGWALTLALVWPVLAAREVGFDLAGLTDRGAIVSWADYSTTPWPAPRAVAWILHWVLAQLLGVLWFDWLIGRFTEQRESLPRAAHALWISATVASAVALVQGTINLSLLNTDFWARLGRAAGTLLDANAYGHVAALAGPVAFLALHRIRLSALASIALALNWVGVWMSGSRTALLCAGIGAAGLVVGAWRIRRPAASSRAIAVTAGLVGAAAAIIVVADAIGPLQRFAEIRADRRSVVGLWQRGDYGPIAIQMVREYPHAGTGAGTYHFLAPDYLRARSDRHLPPDNAQNWWRHQAADLGLFGGAAVLLWSGFLAWRVITARGNLTAQNRVRPVARALLVGIGASSMLGVPTQSPVVLLWFFFLVAWFDVLLGTGAAASPSSAWPRVAWPAAVVLAVLSAGTQLLLAHGSLSVAERARRFNREYVVGTQPPEPMPGAGSFRWTGETSSFYLPARTPWMVLRLWAHHPDIAENPVDVTISTACGVLWEGSLPTPDPVTIGIVLPEGSAFEAAIAVSRTWRPSDHGQGDTRRLGVGVATEFVDSPERARSQTHTPVWPTCTTAETAARSMPRR